MLIRKKALRSTPLVEAYSTGLRTAQVDLSARGWGPCRLFFKAAIAPESAFQQISDWNLTAYVPLSSLASGERYDIRAVDKNGRTFDTRLHMPFETTHPGALESFVSRFACQDTQGRIIANTKVDGGNAVIRRSSDGGINWEDILEIWYGWYMYYHAGFIYGTTINRYANSYKDRLWRIPNVPNQPGDPEIVMGPMFRHQSNDNGTVTYPWCFEPRGPYWIVGASSQYDPYQTWPGGWNESDYGNRIYYTNNNWQTWNEMKAPPYPVPGTPTFPNQLYTRHMHAVCWNPVSRKYFITHGDGQRCNYVVSEDLQVWKLVANGWRYHSPIAEPSGASIGITWLPDGTWLAGNDDSYWGHITKFWPDGRWKIVLETGYFGASMIWDIWAYDDGEVWATGTCDGQPDRLGIVWVSLDWGETWRIVYKAKNSVFQPRWIAGCHETRRLHGPWVFIDQGLDRPYTPGWTWRRFK